METAQLVLGRVVDEHGKPLAGVAVGSYDRRVHRRLRCWTAILAAVWLAPALAQQQSEQTRTVRGRVLDENGKPLAGVAIGSPRWDEFFDTARLLADPTTTTDQDGRYTIDLDAQARRVTFASPGRQACATDTLAIHCRDLADIVLPKGRSVRGRVRDDQGKPIAGARIRVESSLQERLQSPQMVRLLAGAVTDTHGIFSIPGVPPSGLRVTADADGYVAVTRLVALDSPTDLTLLRAVRVSGRVVDHAGQPVADVVVQVLRAEPEDGITTRTGTDGTFSLFVPEQQRYRLLAYGETLGNQHLRSDLLRGRQNSIVLSPPGANQPVLEIRVVSAATKQAIHEFSVTPLQSGFKDLSSALQSAESHARRYTDVARLPLPDGIRPHCLLIQATGHAFAMALLPRALTEPLVVELGPETTITGRVVDDVTGQPLGGILVRALPPARNLPLPHVEENGPRSAADGTFVVGGLQPGEYLVQAWVQGRSPSPSLRVQAPASGHRHCELRVPARTTLEIELNGTSPPGPPPLLWPAARGVNPFLPALDPKPCGGPGRYSFLPTSDETHSLHLYVPSRIRIGAGVLLNLGAIDAAGNPNRIAIPDLQQVHARGRVHLPTGVPTERVAVIATCVREKNPEIWDAHKPAVAGLDSSGAFEFDAPTGAYCLQLVDLRTRIVFHTEPWDRRIDEQLIELRPDIHWLEVRCEPTDAKAPIVVTWFDVSLPVQREHMPVFFGDVAGGGRATGMVLGTTRPMERWLVPKGELHLQAQQYFGQLRPGSGHLPPKPRGHVSITIDGPEQVVRLSIEPPPSDDELRKQ